MQNCCGWGQGGCEGGKAKQSPCCCEGKQTLEKKREEKFLKKSNQTDPTHILSVLGWINCNVIYYLLNVVISYLWIYCCNFWKHQKKKDKNNNNKLFHNDSKRFFLPPGWWGSGSSSEHPPAWLGTLSPCPRGDAAAVGFSKKHLTHIRVRQNTETCLMLLTQPQLYIFFLLCFIRTVSD